MPPTSLSADAYQLPELISGSMQNQLGTFSATASGMPDLKAAQNTYGGMQLLRDVTVGRFYPMLSVRADLLDCRQAYQLLENDKKNLSPDQWEKYAGDYGREAVEAFLKCDLKEDLLISVVPESFMPETPSQKLMKTTGYFEFLGSVAPILNPESAAHVAEQFGQPNSLVGFDSEYSIATGQIEIFKAISDEIVNELGDVPTYDLNHPTTFQLALLVLQTANIPIVPEMDNTETLTNAYQDYWRKDDGRGASNLLKAVLTLRVEELKQGMATAMMDDAKLALEAQQPLQEAQMAEEQAINEQMQAQNAQTEEAETAKVEDERNFQTVNKMVDLEESERGRQHQKELAQMKQT